MNAKIFVVSVGGSRNEDIALVGEDNVKRILKFQQWRGLEAEDLGLIADQICEVDYYGNL